MKQYWPCAKYRDQDGQIKPLFTYDSTLDLARARQTIENWKNWYKYDVRQSWVDVYESGAKVERIWLNKDGSIRKTTVYKRNLHHKPKE